MTIIQKSIDSFENARRKKAQQKRQQEKDTRTAGYKIIQSKNFKKRIPSDKMTTPADEQVPVPKFLRKEAAATNRKEKAKRAKKIKALYNTIDTLRKNELPSKESPKMVRQLSDEKWLKQIHAASRQLNALLKKDNAMERLSDNAHLAVTLGSASLRDVAKGLYFSKDKKSGGKVKNYGYMGGGKVYGQPRKANYKAG
tara:strand:+ start:935 stop:1528 length:594 start_codon:yes stop_codon:yes gene_type:complete